MEADIDGTDPTTPRGHRPRLCGEAVPTTGHICAFFESAHEKYEVLASYFADSIQAGDRVIDVVEGRAREEHVRGITEAGVDLRAALESGQLRLSTCEETYFQDGRLELDAVLEMLRVELRSASADGTPLRTCGDMNWVARDPRSRRRALEYEARVNELLPTLECTMLCTYDLAHTPASMIADILATHPFAIVKGRLRANPWAVEPGAFTEMLERRHPWAGETDDPALE